MYMYAVKYCNISDLDTSPVNNICTCMQLNIVIFLIKIITRRRYIELNCVIFQIKISHQERIRERTSPDQLRMMMVVFYQLLSLGVVEVVPSAPRLSTGHLPLVPCPIYTPLNNLCSSSSSRQRWTTFLVVLQPMVTLVVLRVMVGVDNQGSPTMEHLLGHTRGQEREAGMTQITAIAVITKCSESGGKK